MLKAAHLVLLAAAAMAVVSGAMPTIGYANGDDPVAEGKQIFQAKGCGACHTIGSGRLVGPDLKGVTKRRSRQWLEKMIVSPETMLYSDPIAKKLLEQYMVPMPNQGVTKEEVKKLIDYLEHEDKKGGDDD